MAPCNGHAAACAPSGRGLNPAQAKGPELMIQDVPTSATPAWLKRCVPQPAQPAVQHRAGGLAPALTPICILRRLQGQRRPAWLTRCVPQPAHPAVQHRAGGLAPAPRPPAADRGGQCHSGGPCHAALRRAGCQIGMLPVSVHLHAGACAHALCIICCLCFYTRAAVMLLGAAGSKRCHQCTHAWVRLGAGKPHPEPARLRQHRELLCRPDELVATGQGAAESRRACHV